MKRIGLVLVLALPAAGAAPRQSMVFPGASWQETTPDAQGVDAVKLQAAADWLKSNTPQDGVNELVIVRNGTLIWKGTNIDKKHGIWSCTKSFTSTVLGLLIDDGKCTLDTKASGTLSSMNTTYPNVTLRHFTTMTSGYRANGDTTSGGYTHGPSSTPFNPSTTPLFTPPGSKYAYWDSAMNQFGNTLTRIANREIEVLFKQRIADPIRMDTAKWSWGDWGTVSGIVVNNGAGNHQRMNISAREFARLGHLFLNRGKWNGQQLISAAWVDEATKTQVPASTPMGSVSLSPIYGPGAYGYNWWTNGVKADGKRKWPGAPATTYAASGYNNNDMFVIPDWGMVIVRLGLDEGSGFKIPDSTYSTFLQKVGASISSVPSDPPPNVNLTGPPDGASYAEPASIQLAATASDPGGSVTRVEFHRDGSLLWTDTAAPYSYTWSNVPAGIYVITARATDDAGQTTTSGAATVTVTGAPVPQSVTGFTLVDADADADLGPLYDGDTIDLAALPTPNLNIRAETSPSTVGSVVFGYDGNASYRTESAAPYALAGDTNGNYNAWTPSLGAHSVSGTPYAQPGGTGAAGTPAMITFTVVDNAGGGGGGPGPTGGGKGGSGGGCGATGLEALLLALLVRRRGRTKIHAGR